MPDVMMYVKNAEEVSKILKYANEHLIPVVARGSGTGLVPPPLDPKNPVTFGVFLTMNHDSSVTIISTKIYPGYNFLTFSFLLPSALVSTIVSVGINTLKM